MPPAHNSVYYKAVSSLRTIAVLIVVLNHFWLPAFFGKNDYLSAVMVGFCFFYSGFMIAMHHRFAPYSPHEHKSFLYSRLTKLYPLHVFSLAACVITLLLLGQGISPWLVIGHLSLLQSFVPMQAIYFGHNPISWFVSSIMFLYVMAPLLINLLRRMALRWQIILVVAAAALQFAISALTHADQLGTYFLYIFPPMRMLDFAWGIVFFNITQSSGWKQVVNACTGAVKSHILETCALALFFLFYLIGDRYLNMLCYRGFSIMALAIVSIFAALIATSGCEGWLSKLLNTAPMQWLNSMAMELFLLQHASVYTVELIFNTILPTDIAYHTWPLPLAMTVQMAMLVLFAWLTKKYITTPVTRYLLARNPFVKSR